MEQNNVAGRVITLGAGLICMGLGVIGMFVPLMPSTVFFILAAACFARSSPKLEAWLLSHKVIGPSVRAWRERGAIPRKAKWLASGGMLLGIVVLIFTGPPWFVIAGGAAFLGGCALYIWTRPD